MLLELYSDYLLASFGKTSATTLSQLVDGQVSHDQLTGFLQQSEPISPEVWKLAKPVVREIEQDDGTLAIDDTISLKPHSKENGAVEWFYDHKVGRTVKLKCLNQSLMKQPLSQKEIVCIHNY